MKINHTLTMIKFILCLQDLDCPELLIIYDFELFLNEGGGRIPMCNCNTNEGMISMTI